MTSILESEYKEPERPYSQDELKDNRNNLRKKLKLSELRAEHQYCGHFYHVRMNGPKERNIKENNCNDTGNCSVCWKISKTRPKSLTEKAKDLVFFYGKCFYIEPNILSYSNNDLEKVFYTWLYEDTTTYNSNK